MEPLSIASGFFIYGLYKATEKVWEKALDVAWSPLEEPLKGRFNRLVGTGKESKRRKAFAKAAEVAHLNTIREATDPGSARRILEALNSDRDAKGAEALAEEAAKLMLFSAQPDVSRLTQLCRKNLRWDAIWGEDRPPAEEAVVAVLSGYLTNLREALMDQSPYEELIQKEMLHVLRDVATELRPVEYDDEDIYRAQIAAGYRFRGLAHYWQDAPCLVSASFGRSQERAGHSQHVSCRDRAGAARCDARAGCIRRRESG